MVSKGQKYRATQDVRVAYMIAWAAPCASSAEGVLPKGELFTIANDPPSTATAVYADPESYSELEQRFVPQKDRQHPKYNGFYLCIRLTDIQQGCELLSSERKT